MRSIFDRDETVYDPALWTIKCDECSETFTLPEESRGQNRTPFGKLAHTRNAAEYDGWFTGHKLTPTLCPKHHKARVEAEMRSWDARKFMMESKKTGEPDMHGYYNPVERFRYKIVARAMRTYLNQRITPLPGRALYRLTIGDKITFAEERLAYTVQARSGRYLVCTKPFNPKHTVLYTVVDLVENVRGTENLIFGMGAETREQCEEMIERLEGRTEDGFRSEVSHRNRVPLKVTRVQQSRVSVV